MTFISNFSIYKSLCSHYLISSLEHLCEVWGGGGEGNKHLLRACCLPYFVLKPCFTDMVSFGNKGIHSIVPMLQPRILRHRIVRWFTPSHTATEGQNWHSNSGLLMPNPGPFLLPCGCLWYTMSDPLFTLKLLHRGFSASQLRHLIWSLQEQKDRY